MVGFHFPGISKWKEIKRKDIGRVFWFSVSSLSVLFFYQTRVRRVLSRSNSSLLLLKFVGSNLVERYVAKFFFIIFSG